MNPNSQSSKSHRNYPYKFQYEDRQIKKEYCNAHDWIFLLRRSPQQKQNNIDDNNFMGISYDTYCQSDMNDIKSRASTNEQTTSKISIDNNIHVYHLQSIILELEKISAGQENQISKLKKQINNFINICQQQKQILMQLNIQCVKYEYEQQIKEIIKERKRIQEIVIELQDNWNQMCIEEKKQLEFIRNTNNIILREIQLELQRKKSMLAKLCSKDRQLMKLEVSFRELQEKMDQFRNVQKKLTIAQKELAILRDKKNQNSVSRKNDDEIFTKRKKVINAKEQKNEQIKRDDWTKLTNGNQEQKIQYISYINEQ